VPVDGFAPGICHHCRGIALPPAPKATLRNRKGKVQRYYWREINQLIFAELVAWMDNHNLHLTLGELRKRFPDVVRNCEREALEFWKAEHKRIPRYGTKERDQESFLQTVSVPVSELRARYEVSLANNQHPLGRFRDMADQLVSAEQLARQHYENAGWDVHNCERQLINSLSAVLLSTVYQDPNDPRLMTGLRGSTAPGADRASPEVVTVTLPDDFGTPANYLRRDDAYARRLDELRASPDFVREFERLIESSWAIREYLAVHDAELVLARRAIEVIPRATLCGMLDWTLRDFWNRRRGWPDLLIARPGAYRFVEVKTKKDRLSQEQMIWFGWACGAGNVACEILKILPDRP
jgi:hypothetical protein